MSSDALKYHIAITLIDGAGCIAAKRLIACCGSAEAVLREKKSALQKAPGIGELLARDIVRQQAQVLAQAEEECAFLAKSSFRALCYTDDDYPERLRRCDDAPIVLYMHGTTNLDAPKILGVVGTRRATPYGLEWCTAALSELAAHGHAPVIVSGLAYGIDVCAHRAALQHRLPTVAVMATGLDSIYPSQHRTVAAKIVAEGGALITDFRSGTQPFPANFVRRNRIVAGLCDALLVVESNEKGGALITAELALAYHRELLAVPGRAGDDSSKGCNALIRAGKASMVTSANDIETALEWQRPTHTRPAQLSLPLPLSPEEQRIADALRGKPPETIDTLCHAVHIPMARLSALLFSLEMNGLVRSLPGKQYTWK